MINKHLTGIPASSVLQHPRPEWNDTRRDYPLHVCLHDLVDQQVQRTPDRTAVVYEGQSLTYRQLSLRAEQVAQILRARGLGPGVLVGICMERSLELPVALLGVLKAGAAYVPLDPDYPTERLAHMIEDAQLSLIVTRRQLVESIPELLQRHGSGDGQPETLIIDAGQFDTSEPSADAFESGAQPEHPAYVIYTSGSTGRPKGAMNTHQGICNRLLWMQDEYNIGRQDAVLQKTPASFDVSVWEFFWPLITGARMVLARPRGHLDSNYLCDLIQAQQITVMHFVPSMLHVFLQEPGLDRCRSLRHVICSGEALSVDLQNQFFQRLDARLHNLYGPTEAAIDVTYWECRPGAAQPTVPIGRPVANTQIHLLNEALEPVPIGESGELHIGGVQVSGGYWNRPDLTDEKFIPDPFRSEPNARLYKTGDLARYLPDGTIEFLGRIDQQVKIRGFRIELTEIESVLMQHPGVHSAAVAARDYGPGDRRLVAYLVPADVISVSGNNSSELVQQARQWIQGKLPEYMTPSTFVILSDLLLTPSGKLDRNALPAPPQTRPDLEQPFAPARSELERRLTSMWQEVLRLEQIGIHDRFFELGGDSLRAALFVNSLQLALGEFIYVVTIFQAPTIALYVKLLERDYADAVSRWLGTDSVAPASQADRTAEQQPRVDASMVQRMRDVVPQMTPLSDSHAQKNPRAVFILAPPRSGTTLLRVMLAGHPRLFAAAELQLLCFHTLAERKAAFSGKFSAWLEGTIRAVMDLKQCAADDAKRIMQEYEERNCTTQEFYRVLQQWAGERMLVDKSPHYALDAEALRKAERDFDAPFYIHLVRHPYAMVRSFQNQHMDQILYLNDHDFTTRQLGELVWTVSHQNIAEFLSQIPAERQQRIQYEELAHQPRPVMENLCAALHLEFDPSVLRPYEGQHKKMVDGIYEASTPMGDVNFLRHQEIDPNVADRWKEVERDDFLGEVTWQVARSLGYQRPQETAAAGDDRWSQLKSEAQSRRNQQRQRRARRTRTRADDADRQ